MSLCDWAPYLQGPSAGSDVWPVSYETTSSSRAAIEKRPPSAGELLLIRALRDQLKSAQYELKRVTAKVDVALSKASLAGDAEKFILSEIKNLGNAMECKSSSCRWVGPLGTVL
jgi:hypothetical protein